MHTLIQACSFSSNNLDDLNKIRECIGVTRATFYKSVNLQEDNVNDIVRYEHVKRKNRQGNLLTLKQEQSVIDFCHSDESSSIDSNSKRFLGIDRNGTIEKRVGRVWAVSTMNEQYTLFFQSDTVLEYTAVNTEYEIPSRSFFYSRRCPCVANPTMQPCVDIYISAAIQYTRAISKFIRTNKEICNTLTKALWVQLLSGHVKECIDSICCAKVSHPSLACGVGLLYRVPSFHKWVCINGSCN